MQHMSLFLGRLSFDLLNHESLGTAALVNLPARRDFVSSERQQFRILATGGCAIGNRPINRSIVSENDELRSSVRARCRAFFADGLAESLRERTCRVQDVTLHGHGGSVRSACAERYGKQKQRNCF